MLNLNSHEVTNRDWKAFWSSVFINLPSTSSPGNGVCHELPFLRICFLRPWVPISLSGNPEFSIFMSVSKLELEEESAIGISLRERERERECVFQVKDKPLLVSLL